ncbi:DUF2169 family type VI secretion system accessory protein [Vreelandella sp. GE22]
MTNSTAFPHALFRKLGPGDLEYEVLAVRGTFRFTRDQQPLALAGTQHPIRWQETYAGGPEGSENRLILHDSDVVVGKPSTDIHVSGTLRSPSGAPSHGWRVGMKVGAISQLLMAYGPRSFEWRLLGGWRITSAEPVNEVPLDYRYAFGGYYEGAAAPETSNQAPFPLYYPDNPVGRGWLPSREDYRRLPREAARSLRQALEGMTELPAPQLEAADFPIRSPLDRLPPAGWGPIARWWQPRVDYQGTLDDQWLAERYPYWPTDFNSRFYQSAHPDLITPDYLQGDEEVLLTNCLLGSQWMPTVGKGGGFYCHRTRLPGLTIKALAEQRSGKRTVTALALDTVGIDLDTRELTLTWRALFSPEDPVRRVLVAASPMPTRRRA